MPTDPRLLAAVLNNARWCDLVCRTHGTAGVFASNVWTSARRTPMFYPDAVTLAPAVSTGAVLARIDTVTPGPSVKDSFADLEFGAGFDVLFDARWIFRPANRTLPLAPHDVAWAPVASPEALGDWARAWGDVPDLFRPELLDDGATLVLAARQNGAVIAGAIAFASDGVVGLTNVFDGGSVHAAWAGAVRATAAALPGVPIVGYERGDDLTAALAVGFEDIGPLRIWVESLTT